ncbi:winged helix-turn-helix domain-containing protein [Jannaschia seohaensis]|uniref:winged helix-turn-helix domain-containing protein n=1 Tax=Jannaschia seohaensis TaxID=475081 RepID=UPI000D6B1C71
MGPGDRSPDERVHRYNDEGLDGLSDRRGPVGPPARLSAEQKAELAAIVERGPNLATDGVVRWRRVGLQRVIRERFGVEMHERTVGKQLAALGFRRLSVRPHHPRRDMEAQEAFKRMARPVGKSVASGSGWSCANVSGVGARWPLP